MYMRLPNIVGLVRRLIREEQGAEGMEKLLIVALIVLPLLGLLIIFKNSVWEWAVNRWNTVEGDDSSSSNPQPNAPPSN